MPLCERRVPNGHARNSSTVLYLGQFLNSISYVWESQSLTRAPANMSLGAIKQACFVRAYMFAYEGLQGGVPRPGKLRQKFIAAINEGNNILDVLMQEITAPAIRKCFQLECQEIRRIHDLYVNSCREWIRKIVLERRLRPLPFEPEGSRLGRQDIDKYVPKPVRPPMPVRIVSKPQSKQCSVDLPVIQLRRGVHNQIYILGVPDGCGGRICHQQSDNRAANKNNLVFPRPKRRGDFRQDLEVLFRRLIGHFLFASRVLFWRVPAPVPCRHAWRPQRRAVRKAQGPVRRQWVPNDRWERTPSPALFHLE